MTRVTPCGTRTFSNICKWSALHLKMHIKALDFDRYDTIAGEATNLIEQNMDREHSSSDMEISSNSGESIIQTSQNDQVVGPHNAGETQAPTTGSTSQPQSIPTPIIIYEAGPDLIDPLQLWKEYLEFVHGDDWKKHGHLRTKASDIPLTGFKQSFECEFFYNNERELTGNDEERKVTGDKKSSKLEAKRSAAEKALNWLRENVEYKGA